jgi:hypothetical protein
MGWKLVYFFFIIIFITVILQIDNYSTNTEENLNSGTSITDNIVIRTSNIFDRSLDLGLNLVPIAENVSLSPDPAFTSDNLTLTWDYIDPDNDTEQSPHIQ